jgi:hypothetical protein
MNPKLPQGTPVARYSLSSDPTDLLGQTFDALFHHRKLNSACRRWLLRGILSAVRRQENLDVALGLAAPGQDTPTRKLLLARRNQHLVAALDAVAFDPEVSTWQRCLRLAPEAQRFMRDTWPRSMRWNTPPDEWPDFKKHLWHAMRCDCSMPETAHGLRGAVMQNTRFQNNDHGAKILARFL